MTTSRIEGVYVAELITHSDERGFFREIVRFSNPAFSRCFEQLSHSMVFSGIVKAWHGHKKQHQWTYVASGNLAVAVYDSRPTSATRGSIDEFLMGDAYPARAYMIPPGVLHGYKVLSGPAHVIYLTSGSYDPDEEVRVSTDAGQISYDWFDQRVR